MAVLIRDIMPDLRVEATEEDWRKGNDVQLQAALRVLHERIGYRKGVGRRV